MISRYFLIKMRQLYYIQLPLDVKNTESSPSTCRNTVESIHIQYTHQTDYSIIWALHIYLLGDSDHSKREIKQRRIQEESATNKRTHSWRGKADVKQPRKSPIGLWEDNKLYFENLILSSKYIFHIYLVSYLRYPSSRRDKNRSGL